MTPDVAAPEPWSAEDLETGSDGHAHNWDDPCTEACPAHRRPHRGHADCPDGPDAHEDYCLNGRRE